MELSIIYVNWNSVNYLLDSIASVYEHTHGLEFEIIVIENASGDDIGLVAQRFPGAIVFKSDTNLGFAGANNVGVQMSSGEFVIFLNPDTKLIEPTFKTLIDVIRNLPDAGILGCKLLNSDLTTQTSCIMQFPRILNRAFESEWLRKRWPIFWGLGPLFSDGSRAGKVEAVSGACMVVKRDTLSRVGMFSEDYFMYAEDLDLCYKTVRAGFSNYFTCEARIVHYAGKSSDPDWQTATKLKSELRFCEKHYKPLYVFPFRVALLFSGLARYGIVSAMALASVNADSRRSLRAKRDKWGTTIKVMLAIGFRAGTLSPSPRSRPVDCRSSDA